VARAAETFHGMRGAWVKEQEVQIDNGKISAYKVILKIMLVLDEGQVRARTKQLTYNHKILFA
jgi:flavin-binding protein dodecin